MMSWRDHYYDDYDDEDEEEGENPMTIQDKKFYVVNADHDGGWFKTSEEALVQAKRRAAADRDGDPFMILQSVEFAQAKVPEVDVTPVS